ALALDLKVTQCDEALRTAEARVAEHREKIAANESTIDHERLRVVELEREIARHRQHLTTMNVRAGDLQHQTQEVVAALADAEQRYADHSARLKDEESGLSRINEELEALRSVSEQRRAQQLEQLRAAASLGKR